jgi:hypothetical protein
MGLSTSHDCWSGSYTAFGRFRKALAEAAGLGSLDEYTGYKKDGTKDFDPKDPLTVLLAHSDCDGEISWQDCKALADRLEELIPSLSERHAADAQQFADGLYDAASDRQNVEFS